MDNPFKGDDNFAANQLKHTCRYTSHCDFGLELPYCKLCGAQFTCGPFEHACVNPACADGKENLKPCLKCRKERIYCRC